MSEPVIQPESAKEVAGKTIGKQGLFYITLIVCVGVGASIVLEESKMNVSSFKTKQVTDLLNQSISILHLCYTQPISTIVICIMRIHERCCI